MMIAGIETSQQGICAFCFTVIKIKKYIRLDKDVLLSPRLGVIGFKNSHERLVSEKIIQYLESRICADPPKPFILAGEIIKDLEITKSEFYLGAGLILGYRIDEHIEGNKRYFYLTDIVGDYRAKKKKTSP